MSRLRDSEAAAWLRARVCGVLLLLSMVLFGSGVALMSVWADAGALGGATGPINVTVTPTTGLTDGQVVTIDAQTTSGTMTEIAAHICQPGQSIDNNGKWSFQGPFCSKVAPGAGDFSKSQLLANTATGSLTFKAGITPADGIIWVDELGFVHSLTCDSTHVCDLVIRFQHSAGTSFFTAPLSFAGGGGTTTTSSTTSTSTTSTSTTTTAPPGSTTTTSSTTTTKPPATTTTSSTTTTVPATTTTGHTTTTTTVPGPVQMNPTSGPPGTPITVNSDTWKPASEATVTFNSDPIELGKLTADGTGKVTGTFAVPAGVPAGAHTVTLTGTGSDEQAQTLTQPFTVTTPNTATTVTGTATKSSNTGTSGGSGALAFTGASTRDVLSVALMFLAAGILCLDVSIRRRVRA